MTHKIQISKRLSDGTILVLGADRPEEFKNVVGEILGFSTPGYEHVLGLFRDFAQTGEEKLTEALLDQIHRATQAELSQRVEQASARTAWTRLRARMRELETALEAPTADSTVGTVEKLVDKWKKEDEE